MTLPEKIRKARKSLNLSQEALARKIGVSWVTISRWERGVSQPHGHAKRIEKVLGVKVGDV